METGSTITGGVVAAAVSFVSPLVLTVRVGSLSLNDYDVYWLWRADESLVQWRIVVV